MQLLRTTFPTFDDNFLSRSETHQGEVQNNQRQATMYAMPRQAQLVNPPAA